jgi:hypothetical protein
MKHSSLPEPLTWNPTERRLRSQDKILIVTDVYTYRESKYDSATEQQWFQVGAIDLDSNEVGMFKFSVDDARAMVKIGVAPPPWAAAHTFGLHIVRQAHVTGHSTGRFAETIQRVNVAPAILALVPKARSFLKSLMPTPNAQPGIWSKLVAAADLESKTIAAIMTIKDVFKASDVTDLVPDAGNVSPLLKRLVGERRILRVTKKTYRVV